MKVSFIAITPDAENLIVYCARVSNPENQHNTETSPRLIKYLINHEHWSPLILPLCTKTRLYMSGSIRSWIHYIKLRTKPDTQKEHRLIAEECKKIFAEKMPVIADAVEWNI